MAKKTTSRSKAEQKPDAPEAAESLPTPRTRTRAPKPQPDAPVAVAGDRSTSVAETRDLTTSVSMASEPSEEDIRLRAYQRYLERGGGHGMDFEDWLEAERELKHRR
jgi:hypothetical protein